MVMHTFILKIGNAEGMRFLVKLIQQIGRFQIVDRHDIGVAALGASPCRIRVGVEAGKNFVITTVK